MAQTQKVLLLAIIVAIVAPIPGALAQDELSRFTPPATNRPILNTFRSRTTDNLVTDAFKRFSQNSPLSGKLCPKCAEKRNARFSEQAADKELLQKAKAATLEKLEQEAKKLKFEAKALEEADYEKHKPWDVAAPENKESPSPLLQAAQASKEDQDLAPKKIRALEYLAQLGCNKDPNVEAAIIAGLQDHNPAVRYAAIHAVIATARGVSYDYTSHPFGDNIVPQQPEVSIIDPLEHGLEQECYPAKEPSQLGGVCPKEEPKPEDPCQECVNCKRKRKPCLQRLKGLCKRCKGHGCQTCNYGGHDAAVCQDCAMPMDALPAEGACEACQPCVAHNGCITCCPSKKIQAELKRIAFDPDPERPGCYYEPSIDLRNLALEALHVCPPLKADQDDDDGGPIIESKDGDQEENARPLEANPVPDDSNDLPEIVSPGDQANRVSSFVPISHRRASAGSNLLMSAKIAKFYSNGFLIDFEDDYLIPVNKQLLIELADGKHHIVRVIKSDVGFAQVVSADGQLLSSPSPTIHVGVLENE